MDVSASPPTRAAPSFRLWFALLGGMSAYALHLVIGFWAVPAACGAGREGLVPWLVTTATVVAAGIAVAATAVAVRVRRALREQGRQGDRPSGTTGLPHGWDVAPASSTAHFMATAGVVLSAMALTVILLAGLPLLVVSPCA